MLTDAGIRKALGKISNLSEFATKYSLPLRTLSRIKAGGVMRIGTRAVIAAALVKERLS